MNQQLQRILVTGGAGFIGSHTVDLLLAEDFQVVVLDNLSSGKLENLNLKHPNLEFIEGDILEYPFVLELIKNVDAILHLAAIASVPLSLSNPIYTFQVNTQGFLHVLEGIHESKRDVPLVYASSAAVYGDAKTLPCNDELPLQALPLSPYALQKIHNEEYANLYFRLYAQKSLGLRYFNVYGERQDPNSPYSGVLSRFIQAYFDDKPLIIYGDGEQSRDFISVKEVAKANLISLKKTLHGAVNIATGTPNSLKNIINLIEEAGKKKAQIRYENARSGDIKCSYGSINLAKSWLDFSAQISLKTGISELVGGGGEEPI